MGSGMRIAPCPTCKTNKSIGVATYDYGWKHVECDGCGYMGPGEGSRRQAINSHNERCASAPAQQ